MERTCARVSKTRFWSALTFLECANLLALWYSATCRRRRLTQVVPSDGGDRSPNTKAVTGHRTPN